MMREFTNQNFRNEGDRAVVCDWVRSCGHSPDDVRAVLIDGAAIEFVKYQRDAKGAAFMDPKRPDHVAVYKEKVAAPSPFPL